MSFIQNVGENLQSISSIYKSITSDLKDENASQFESIKSAYTETSDAFVDTDVPKVPGTRSIFNPWKIFRYSRFGMNVDEYKYELHLDSALSDFRKNEISTKNNDPALILGNSDEELSRAQARLKNNSDTLNRIKPYADNSKIVENPTASTIIAWSRDAGKKGFTVTKGSPYPYSSEDFLWCKYYGKIPNNRMVTLRRYPIPIEDNLAISEKFSPLVPIAQAVTWYGKDIDNDLNNILGFNWGFKWIEKVADVKDLEGNEVIVDDIIDLFMPGISDTKKSKMAMFIRNQLMSPNSKLGLLQISGYDKKIKDYIKNSYNQESGPYWNRILGPVNVIDRTLIRDRGFLNQNDITISFEYSLRTYGGVNPKIAFLDLLSNFLSLTYSTAPFWGGAIRYFQRTGVTLRGLAINDYIMEGDVAGGIAHMIEQLKARLGDNFEKLDDLKGILMDAYNSPDTAETTDTSGKKVDTASAIFNSAQFQKYAAQKLSKLLQAPLSYRSFLSDKAIGEWHLTVGNPMNPMAMIGNLCLNSVKMEVGETLGLDDFPTEFKFVVKLKHGKPRDRKGLESMFNLGGGQMGFSELPQPSSSYNSYGERNTQMQKLYTGDINENQIPPSQKYTKIVEDQLSTDYKFIESDGNGNSVDRNNPSDASVKNGTKIPTIDELTTKYGSRVRTMYGDEFRKDETLKMYFRDLKTKD
jgi:hypothetical protein